MKNTWKRDCAALCGITGGSVLAAAALLAVGGAWASAFGAEFLVTALMFAPCAWWRLVHRDQ